MCTSEALEDGDLKVAVSKFTEAMMLGGATWQEHNSMDRNICIHLLPSSFRLRVVRVVVVVVVVGLGPGPGRGRGGGPGGGPFLPPVLVVMGGGSVPGRWQYCHTVWTEVSAMMLAKRAEMLLTLTWTKILEWLVSGLKRYKYTAGDYFSPFLSTLLQFFMSLSSKFRPNNARCAFSRHACMLVHAPRKQKRYRAVEADATLALELNPDSAKAQQGSNQEVCWDSWLGWMEHVHKSCWICMKLSKVFRSVCSLRNKLGRPTVHVERRGDS